MKRIPVSGLFKKRQSGSKVELRQINKSEQLLRGGIKETSALAQIQTYRSPSCHTPPPRSPRASTVSPISSPRSPTPAFSSPERSHTSSPTSRSEVPRVDSPRAEPSFRVDGEEFARIAKVFQESILQMEGWHHVVWQQLYYDFARKHNDGSIFLPHCWVTNADGSVCAFPTILASAELQLPSLNVPRPVFTAAPSPPPARQPSASPPARQPAASLPARKPGRPMKRTISESEMVTCSDCSKVFSGPKPLALHKRERCGKDGVKDYECGRCKKKFAYKSTVRRHEVKCRV